DIVVDGRATQLTSDQLRGLRPASAGSVRAHGWPLADVIALATSATELHAVRLEGAQPVDIAPQDLHAPGKTLWLKANQRGEYVLRVWEPGAKYPTREVRGVTQIVVEHARGYRP